MKKIMANSAAALVAQIVSVICGLVLPRLILESFGSEINGLTQSIKQFLGVISFLDLGVGQVMRSALYRPLAKKDDKQLSCVMCSGRKFYKRLACILMGYVLVLMVVYPMLAEVEFGWLYVATLILAMAISSFAQYYFGIANEQLLQADQRGYVVFLLQIVGNILNVVASVWAIRAGASIQVVKTVTALVFLLRPIGVWLYVRRHYHVDRKVQYAADPITQKKDGMAQHISAVVLDGTDTIVLTFLSTLTNVSIYSVYYMVIASIQGLYQSTTAGIQSAAGLLWAQRDTEGINRMFMRVEMLLHAAVTFVFSCTAVLIVPFVRVYTNGLTDAEYVQPVFAALLVLAYGIRSLRTPYNIWILAAGHYRQTRKCHILAASINVVVSIVAVSRWGLIGVAIGTLVAMVYQTLWMAWYSTKTLLKRPAGSVAKRFLIDALMAVLICLLTRGISLMNLDYLSWCWMAVKVALVSMMVICGVLCLFYRKDVRQIIEPWLRGSKMGSRL
nr:polysaccharide biosynthesis C-terminal domain-containing protein [Clostridia bacterium]